MRHVADDCERYVRHTRWLWRRLTGLQPLACDRDDYVRVPAGWAMADAASDDSAIDEFLASA
jgi:hypothetical protein